MFPKNQKLIFVYNLKTGFLNTIVNKAHKILSPSTYPCGLCIITHGNFSEKELLIKFRCKYNIQIEFLYKNKFDQLYGQNLQYSYSFPVVLNQCGDKISVLVNSKEIGDINSVESLITLIEERI